MKLKISITSSYICSKCMRSRGGQTELIEEFADDFHLPTDIKCKVCRHPIARMNFHLTQLDSKGDPKLHGFCKLFGCAKKGESKFEK